MNFLGMSRFGHLVRGVSAKKSGEKFKDEDDESKMRKAESEDDEGDSDMKKSKKAKKADMDDEDDEDGYAKKGAKADDKSEEDEEEKDEEEEEKDDDSKSKKGKKAKAKKAAADDEENCEADDEKSRAARKSERARCARIMSHPAAAENLVGACHLAFDTDMPSAAAIGLLMAMSAGSSGQPAQSRGRLSERMATQKNPDLGVDAPSKTSASSFAAEVIAAGKKRRGEI